MQIKNNWITGFVDGDGCFAIRKIMLKNNEISIRHKFIVSQDRRSVDVLYAIKKKFKCGNVYKSGGNMYEFSVSDKKSLIDIIIPFFIKYPLQSEKRKNFYKFVESINKTLNNPVYEDFHLIEMKKFKVVLNDEWIAGFIDADGCFNVSFSKDYPQPRLFIGVSSVDSHLIRCLQRYLECGNILIRKTGFLVYTISRINHLIDKIFPKLYTKTSRNLLKTIKRINFQKFRKIVLMLQTKKHLTETGMQKIKILQCSMNKITLPEKLYKK